MPQRVACAAVHLGPLRWPAVEFVPGCPAGGGTMSRVALAGAVAVIGLLVLALILGFLELEPREAVLTVAALGTYVVAFASRRPLPVLLFAWVVALTYGKAFFVYPPADSPDFHGIYWIYSDVFLLGVLLIWFRR